MSKTNMFSSIMRVYGNFDMPAEVNYHLSQLNACRSGSWSLLNYHAHYKKILSNLQRLANNNTGCQEIINKGGIGSLVTHARYASGLLAVTLNPSMGNDDRDRDVALLNSLLQDMRRLLGKLLFNDENIELLQLLLAAIKKNMEYHQLLIITKDDPTPVHIDRETLVIQFKDDYASVYYSTVDFCTITINRQSVSQHLYEILLPLKSLKKSEDKNLIRAILKYHECYYDKKFSQDLRSTLAGFDGQSRRIVRNQNGIQAILTFMLELSEILDRFALRELIAFLKNCCGKNATYLTTFIQAGGIELFSTFLIINGKAFEETLITLDSLSGGYCSDYKYLELEHMAVLTPIITLDLIPKIQQLVDRAVWDREPCNPHYRDRYYDNAKSAASNILHKCNLIMKKIKENKLEEEKQQKIQKDQEEATAISSASASIRNNNVIASTTTSRKAQDTEVSTDAFSELSNLFTTAFSSQTTVKAGSDWIADLTTTLSSSIQAIFPTLSDMHISSSLTTIPWPELVIQQELGRGGFGVVNKALWQGTQVAVKQLIAQQLTPELVSEFRSEAEVHARVRHPNIVAFYGVCISKYAIVMEFMAKGSLFDVLKSPAELPWSLRFNLALDMISGLLYLHTQEILHRDLKSLNILVDDQLRAKITDFGLAKIKHTTATLTQGEMGSPHWMAPELFDMGGTCNKATDIYSSGIVLWEIAARKLPYGKASNKIQIIQHVAKGNRESIPSDAPPKYAVLISRCWSQRAENRPTIEEVAREMREIHFADNSISKNHQLAGNTSVVDSGFEYSGKPR